MRALSVVVAILAFGGSWVVGVAVDARAGVTPAPCPGDWNGNGRVTVSEVVLAVNAALLGCDELDAVEPGDEEVRVTIGSAVGTASDTVEVHVTLRVGTPSGVENSIEFPLDAQLHSCEPNPGIDRPATIFDFEPESCVEGSDCESVKALVLSLDSVGPIPSGSVLYSCLVDLPDEGCRPLRCLDAGASDEVGVSLDTVCDDGEVCVAGHAPPCPGDTNRDGRVTIAELVGAVRSALEGCA